MNEETLEEDAANLADPNICKTDNWIAGAKWQAERMYSEEEVKDILIRNKTARYSCIIEWFEQNEKK